MGYRRDIRESFDYLNAMKNGTVADIRKQAARAVRQEITRGAAKEVSREVSKSISKKIVKGLGGMGL